MALYQTEAMNWPPSQDFKDCFALVKAHLVQKSDNGLVWQKSQPHPPFLEHLSFHLGNQKFFVTITDVDQKLEVPNDISGAAHAARLFNGLPCAIFVEKSDGNWSVIGEDWCLYAPENDEWPVHGLFNPIDLLTTEKIPLNQNELHYAAVRGKVEQFHDEFEGSKFRVQYDPGIFPSFTMQRPGIAYEEAFCVFANPFASFGSDKDERKRKLIEMKSTFMDLGLKAFSLDVQVIAAEQDLGDEENIVQVCRCEPYYIMSKKLEYLE